MNQEVRSDSVPGQVAGSQPMYVSLLDKYGVTDVLLVRNFDDKFEFELGEAYTKWMREEGDFSTVVYGYLRERGYEVEELDFRAYSL